MSCRTKVDTHRNNLIEPVFDQSNPTTTQIAVSERALVPVGQVCILNKQMFRHYLEPLKLKVSEL